jgi:hypothetical protein
MKNDSAMKTDEKTKLTFEISVSELLYGESTQDFLVNLDLTKKFDFDVGFKNGVIEKIKRTDKTKTVKIKENNKHQNHKCDVHIDFCDLPHKRKTIKFDLPEQVLVNCQISLDESGVYQLFLSLPKDEVVDKNKKDAKKRKVKPAEEKIVAETQQSE